MSNHIRLKKTLTAIALAAAALTTARAAAADEIKAPPPPAPPPTAAPAGVPPAYIPPKSDFVTASSKEGFSIQSGDGSFVLRLKGYMQTDLRAFGSDRPTDGTEVLIRRARPVLEGTVYRYYKFRLMPDFGQGQSTLYDAYAETAFTYPINVRAGKFKPPVGLERLQSATALAFPERGLPTNLVPNRDLGLQLQGGLGDGLFEYQAGVFNGTPDGANVNGDPVEDSKEFAGRVFVKPFKDAGGLFADLGVGFAGTVGHMSGETNTPEVNSYKTPGQQNFFTYGATVLADGLHYRLAPQAYWYKGPFGLLGEYVFSSQEVAVPGNQSTIDNDAWQVLGLWAITGEPESYKGLAPAHDLSFETGDLGAFELVARVGALYIDDAAFPVFASPATSAKEAFSGGVGVNWYWNKAVKISTGYDHTTFDSGSAAGDRADEDVVITRVQLAF